MGTADDPQRSVRVRIEGRVQGVGFRYWVENTANDLGLTGWVRNRRDGSVEALFAGAASSVTEMLERCRHGPPSAHVTAVTVEEESREAPRGFDLLPTV
jgi:acylphosphatase